MPPRVRVVHWNDGTTSALGPADWFVLGDVATPNSKGRMFCGKCRHIGIQQGHPQSDLGIDPAALSISERRATLGFDGLGEYYVDPNDPRCVPQPGVMRNDDNTEDMDMRSVVSTLKREIKQDVWRVLSELQEAHNMDTLENKATLAAISLVMNTPELRAALAAEWKSHKEKGDSDTFALQTREMVTRFVGCAVEKTPTGIQALISEIIVAVAWGRVALALNTYFKHKATNAETAKRLGGEDACHGRVTAVEIDDNGDPFDFSTPTRTN